MPLTDWLGFSAGLVIATLTAPVGVSGAVFLLPVELSVLSVPSPAVTPTNLLFNIVAAPGALARYRTRGTLTGPLTRTLVLGTVPGVLLGALIRTFAVPGARAFHLLAALLLLSVGLWLYIGTLRRRSHDPRKPPSHAAITTLALTVGTIGGIYGIGGGSILGPILVARGLPVAKVAPAALASTFVTSLVGALAFLALAATAHTDTAPHWRTGLLCGLGGLVGGYLGARLQPHLPETALRLLLGTLATVLGVLYLTQALAHS